MRHQKKSGLKGLIFFLHSILTLVLIILVVTTTIYDEVRSKDYKHSEFIGDKQQSVRKSNEYHE